MKSKLESMKEKVKILNEAAEAYYQHDIEIIPNIEYDRLYDELLELEKETGITLSNSPTVHIGYELLSNLPKERHDKPMLSLDKTKDIEVLKSWLGKQTGLLSWKLDGLTIVLNYSDGKLTKALTRGNGEVGEVITNNARVFANIPLNIGFKGPLSIRGEAIIRYSDFYRINQEIEDVSAKYKNPRNLSSGSVRQLNNKITAERNVRFIAFSLVTAGGISFGNSRTAQLEWLKEQGFEIIEFKIVNQINVEESIKWFAENIDENDFPSDGLVLTYDDIEYGEALGATSKFPRDSIALKWYDETMETKLLEIEWSASRTGLINPIAIFEPVELEGTTVSRASVHNVSILERLELGINDKITVYKANMIIPQVSENLTRSGNVQIPKSCPVCNGSTEIAQENGVKFLYCPNPDCAAKHMKSFNHILGRNALNIEGLSEATIEKLIAKGFIKEYADLFHLDRFKEEIVEMEGFGEKSFNNLVASANKARKTTVERLLFGLGIPGIGVSNAKTISKKFGNDWERIQNATYDQLITINGVGEVMAESYTEFFKDDKNKKIIQDLLHELEFDIIEMPAEDLILENINIVITGTMERFKNRDELKGIIESKGGKVTDSVTSKTHYLINNDTLSNSSKNKKAKELGIPIINEQQFIEWIDSGDLPETTFEQKI